jgi:septum formation protein
MNSESLPERLILASSSKYRKLLLERLGIPFECQSPEIDESALADETPLEVSQRLATEKAGVISRKYPRAIVIGSDQLAAFEGQIIGKPGTFPAAFEQLSLFSGQVVDFHTTVSVQSLQSGFKEFHTDLTRVHFRALKQDEIERYLEKERPFDCAGSFKAESLGVTLFDRINSEDPTALIGLPLIRTSSILRRAGLCLP